jgi:small redox-active disulfide protein 2
MLVIKVLGPGCVNCDRLQQHAHDAVEQWKGENIGTEVILEKITDVETFLKYDLITTPGLVINEELVSSGKIPAPSQIKRWLDDAHARA